MKHPRSNRTRRRIQAMKHVTLGVALGAGLALGASVDWLRGDLAGDRGRFSLGVGFAPVRRVFGEGLVLRQHAGGGAGGVTAVVSFSSRSVASRSRGAAAS